MPACRCRRRVNRSRYATDDVQSWLEAGRFIPSEHFFLPRRIGTAPAPQPRGIAVARGSSSRRVAVSAANPTIAHHPTRQPPNDIGRPRSTADGVRRVGIIAGLGVSRAHGGVCCAHHCATHSPCALPEGDSDVYFRLKDCSTGKVAEPRRHRRVGPWPTVFLSDAMMLNARIQTCDVKRRRRFIGRMVGLGPTLPGYFHASAQSTGTTPSRTNRWNEECGQSFARAQWPCFTGLKWM